MELAIYFDFVLIQHIWLVFGALFLVEDQDL